MTLSLTCRRTATIKAAFQVRLGRPFFSNVELYPTGAVIELKAKVENLGQHDLLLDSHIDPLSLTLKDPPGDLKAYSSVQGQFGFQSAGGVSSVRDFRDWVVLGNELSGESILIGGEPGLGVLGWKATTHPSASRHDCAGRNRSAEGQKGRACSSL